MSSLEDMTPEQRDALALRKLFNHPEVGLEAKRLYKKAVPDARFPDLEQAEARAAERAELQKEIDALKDQAKERDLMARRAENHRKIRESGFDPEAIEKIMTENKIASYDTAVTFAEQQRQLAPATPSAITPIQMPDNMKEIQKNPAAWARAEASKAIDELKRKRFAV